ncbi:MAG: hypothetical protein ACON4T_07640 [Synechococcus sp.]
MTLDDLKADLSDRLGQRVIALSNRDGEPAREITDLYQPSPAGFGGQLRVGDGSFYVWDLWLEDGESWNFYANCVDR